MSFILSLLTAVILMGMPYIPAYASTQAPDLRDAQTFDRLGTIRMLTNRTLVGLTPDGIEWYEYIKEDGTIYYGSSVLDKIYFGRWAMQDDKICFTYVNRSPGVYYCHALLKDRAGQLWVQPTNFQFPPSVVKHILVGDAYRLYERHLDRAQKAQQKN